MAGSIGGGNLFGDGLAVLMTFGCAVYLVMIRAYRGTPVVWAAAVSSLLLFPAGWIFADPLAISGRDFAVVATFGLICRGVILWTEGARFLPARSRAARRDRSAARDPVRLAVPCRIAAAASIVGGAIVLVAVFAHAGRDLLVQRRANTDPAVSAEA